jgi:hypothetical protein
MNEHLATVAVILPVTVSECIVAYATILPFTILAVGIATGYGLDDRRVGIRVSVGSRIFVSSYRSDWLWGPPSLLTNIYIYIYIYI